MDFEHSEQARACMASVERFIDEEVLPNEPVYFEQLVDSRDYREWKVPPVIEELKAKARALGLWNLFLPDAELGAGLNNREYSPVAESMGRSPTGPLLGSQSFGKRSRIMVSVQGMTTSLAAQALQSLGVVSSLSKYIPFGQCSCPGSQIHARGEPSFRARAKWSRMSWGFLSSSPIR